MAKRKKSANEPKSRLPKAKGAKLGPHSQTGKLGDFSNHHDPKVTAKQKELFLEAFAQTANVSYACEVAGTTRRSAYNWREKDKDFSDKWDEAYETAVDRMEEAARSRAVDGVRKRKFWQGEEIKVRNEETGKMEPYLEVEYSDQLLMFLLKSHRPDRFREKYDLNVSEHAVDKAIEGLLGELADSPATGENETPAEVAGKEGKR